MNALEIQNRLDSVGHKLQDFLNAFRIMRNEVESLKKENAELRAKLDTRTEEIQHFQNKRKIGKLVDALDEGGTDTSELKNLLDRYINEIDQCIEILKE